MRLLIAGLLCCAGWIVGPVFADDAPPSDPVEPTVSAEERAERMRALAESYEVYSDTSGERRATLLEEPVFRWSNPQREAIAGDMYLWTDQGRPHATIGIWTYDDVQDSHELQSLASAPFVARGSLYSDWKPEEPGVEFVEIDAKVQPSRAAPLRLGQMRKLARDRFAARLTKSNNDTEELRFLPQPLYRYGRDRPDGVVDGAMFAFAYGTDPEVLLIMEIRETDNGPRFFAALGSATSGYAEGTLDGAEIWNNGRKYENGTFRMYIRR